MKNLSINTKFFALLTLYLLLVGAAFFLVLRNVYEDQLRSQGRTIADNVEAFGAWVAQYGRVWVRTDNASFLGQLDVLDLSHENQMITFYSKNPALAQREFSEVVAASNALAKFRMTSHNYMNPANKPDPFETRALEVVRGRDVTEFEAFEGGVYRYARAVYHAESCIACHGDPATAPEDVRSRYGTVNGFGFKAGDVAGVISVRIPSQSLLKSALSVVGPLEVGIVLLALGIAVLFIRNSVLQPIRRLTHLAGEISTGRNVELGAASISENTRDEVQQLTLAVERLRTSLTIVGRRFQQLRKAAQQKSTGAAASRPEQPPPGS